MNRLNYILTEEYCTKVVVKFKCIRYAHLVEKKFKNLKMRSLEWGIIPRVLKSI